MSKLKLDNVTLIVIEGRNSHMDMTLKAKNICKCFDSINCVFFKEDNTIESMKDHAGEIVAFDKSILERLILSKFMIL